MKSLPFTIFFKQLMLKLIVLQICLLFEIKHLKSKVFLAHFCRLSSNPEKESQPNLTELSLSPTRILVWLRDKNILVSVSTRMVLLRMVANVHKNPNYCGFFQKENKINEVILINNKKLVNISLTPRETCSSHLKNQVTICFQKKSEIILKSWKTQSKAYVAVWLTSSSSIAVFYNTPANNIAQILPTCVVTRIIS